MQKSVLVSWNFGFLGLGGELNLKYQRQKREHSGFVLTTNYEMNTIFWYPILGSWYHRLLSSQCLSYGSLKLHSTYTDGLKLWKIIFISSVIKHLDIKLQIKIFLMCFKSHDSVVIFLLKWKPNQGGKN